MIFCPRSARSPDCLFARRELSFILHDSEVLGFSSERKLRQLDVVSIVLAAEEDGPGHRRQDVVDQLDVCQDDSWDGRSGL